jgi:hypothetical protein
VCCWGGGQNRNSKYFYVYNTILRVGLTVLNDVASLGCLFRNRNIEKVYIADLRASVRARVCMCVCVCVCVRLCVSTSYV